MSTPTPGTCEDPSAAAPASSDVRAVLRVVRGNPSPEELAALVAVVTARASGAAEAPPPPARSRWADPAGLVRRPLPTGPGAWRASALPR